jgi:hypothetical protein
MTYIKQVHPHPSPALGTFGRADYPFGPHPRDGLRGHAVGGFWDSVKYTAGQSMANEFSNAKVDAAEARGAPRTTVAAWRALLVDFNNAKDLNSIQALGLEADGWSAAGNAGVITTRASDTVEAAKAKILAVVEQAGDATAGQLKWWVGGLAVLYVVISARRGLL